MADDASIRDHFLRIEGYSGSAFHADAQEALKYAERLFDHAPAAYVVTTSDLAIQHANKAAIELLDAPSGLLQRKPLDRYILHTERPILRAMLDDLNTEERTTRPLCVVSRKGREREVIACATRLRGEPGDSHVLWILMEAHTAGNPDLL